jgi:hypothetical protein
MGHLMDTKAFGRAVALECKGIIYTDENKK